MKHFTFAATAWLILLGLAVVANAQVSVNATVQGSVTDPSGAVIPGAAVTATNVNTGIVTNRQSNATGDYQLPALQPGNYTISGSYQGFQTQTYQNVELSQGQQVRLNFTLQPATANTEIEVIADASTIIAETSPSVENTIQERSVLNFPVLTRNVLDQIGTTPGVVVTSGIFGNATPQMSGTAAGAVNTTRDGLITNDGRYNAYNGVYSSVFTSPDMVEEVRVSTNSIDSTVGRGSAQVQMRTRGGTNEYHGALFYTNNNSALQSRDYFAALRGAKRSYANRNQFGGRLGGSIIKNKAFFFVLVDEQRYLTKQLVTSQVLTPQARMGVFRYLADPATGIARRNGNALAAPTARSVDLHGNVLTQDPVTGTPLQMRSFNVFSQVQDPLRTGIDPNWVSSQWLPRMPLPNDWSVGDGLNTAGYRWLQPQNGSDGATGASPNPNRDHLTTRFDYQVNDANRLTYTMTRETNWAATSQTGLAAYPGGFQGQLTRTPNFYTASWSSSISPTLLSEFRFGYKRDTWIGTSPFDTGYNFGTNANAVDSSAMTARSTYPQNNGQFVYINPSIANSYSNLNISTPRATYSPLKQIADTFSMSKGAHSLQFGFQFNWFNSKSSNAGGQQTTRPYANLGQSNIAVQGISTAAFPGLSTFDIPTAQNLLANLAGSVDSVYQQAFTNSPTQTTWSTYQNGFLYNRNFHQNDWNLFFKDTWKVTQNLTLTLGLRYDKYGTPYESNGLGARLTPASLFGISGTSFANGWMSPGIMNGSPTTISFVGKDSPNPGQTIFNNDWNNIAPSLGFSYDLSTFGKPTVIRGGYGINYSGSPNFLGYSLNLGGMPGTTQTQTLNASQGSYMNIGSLGGLNLPLVPQNAPFQMPQVGDPTGRSANITGYNSNYRIPYIQSYNLSITREIAEGLTLELGWVGNKATKLWDNFAINDPNIYSSGLLNAFNTTVQGGNAQLFNQMLSGIAFPGGVVGQNGFTGSDALRGYFATNGFLANNAVGDLGNWLNSTASFTGANGGILAKNGFPANYLVTNPQFAGVNLFGNNNNSTYNSLQLTINQRFRNGFSWQFSYVYSKNLGNTGVRNPLNRNLSKGILSMNRPHILKFNGVWDLPFGQQGQLFRSAPRWLDGIIGGWTLSPVVQWTSGSPMSFNYGGGFFGGLGTQNYYERGNNTANQLGPVTPGGVQKNIGNVTWFNQYSVQPVAFNGDPSLAGRVTNNVVVDQNGNAVMGPAAAGSVGNMSQNIMTGPGQLTFNTSVSKKVYLNESMYFTLRADVINILNKPQWYNPVTNINSSQFGQITQAGGQRAVTLNARFDF